jgi:hypothetical protein
VRAALLTVLTGMLLAGAASGQTAGQAGDQSGGQQAGGPTFHGFLFGDVMYVATERSTLPEGFLIGQVVGHGNAHLSNRLSFFGEVSATARDAQYNIEIERAILRYDFADQIKLSAGRYHTPVSYWNTAFHHGTWLQTSVARPELIKIGGTFLPVHFVGVLAEGTLAVPAASLSYSAGLGNGRAAAIGRAGDAGDINSKRAITLNAQVRPTALFGLQVGGSVYFDRAQVTAGGVDERIATGHVVWDHGAPELVAEYVSVKHSPLFLAAGGGAPDVTSEGFYVHGGLRLPGSLSSVKPYARIERMDVGAGDAVFAALQDYDATVIGVRWDFESFGALKSEFRSESFAGGSRLKSLFLQATFVVSSMPGM